jgi:hypothetical protein
MSLWPSRALGGFIALLLAGCGGGGLDGGGGDGLAEGGIGGTGISRGSISSFGSIVVEGERFDTSGAVFVLDGLPDSEDALRVGQVVRVTADFDAGTADEVMFTPDVAGPVDANAIEATSGVGTLTVLGQTVRVRPGTVVAGAAATGTPADFAPGTRVLVSGFRDTSGRIVATYIGAVDVPDDEWLTGRIATVDAPARRFVVGQVSVDYSAAGAGADFPGGTPSVGDRVRVRGAVSGGVLFADAVDPYTALGGADGSTVRVTGLADDDEAAAGLFVLAGNRVDARTATFTGGDEGELDDDTPVLVEGVRQDAGTIRADRVVLLPEIAVQFEGAISSVDVSSDRLRVLGDAAAFMVDERTRLADDDGGGRLSLADLGPGDCVEIAGHVAMDAAALGAGATVIADRLEREDDDCDAEVELQAPVEAVDQAAGTLQVIGLTLIAPAGFDLASVTPGTVVEADWDPFVSLDRPPDQLAVADDGGDGDDDDDDDDDLDADDD